MKRKWLANTAILLISTTLALLLGEWLFRRMIFNESPAFSSLRDAGKYADSFNEADYWKLYYLFGGEYGPPEDPHPLLGWIGDFKRRSLMHNRIEQVGQRRPVLLYGDSYAQCMPEVTCFQDILNPDTAFSREHFMLNYGVGGYGVDQIALLFENTYLRYHDPVVIFSLMATDLDRTPLDWRTGQKPWFSAEGDGLKLNGLPIDPDPRHYIEEHGVGFHSFLWRRFLYSEANFLPDRWNASFKKWDQHTEQKVLLNTRLLDRVVDELRDNDIDFIFVVFHYLTPDQPEFSVDNDDNWRDQLLRHFLDERKVPYVWSKDVIRNDPAWNGNDLDRYMIPSNGHPTTYLNELIAREMKDRVLSMNDHREHRRALQAPPTYEEQVAELVRAIRSDSAWLAGVREHAVRDGQTLDERLLVEAWYTLEEASKNVDEAIARYTAP